MKRCIFFLLCLLLATACTSSRWVVTDQHSINREKEPVVLNEEHILLLEKEPTVENPVMSFATYKVVEKEYEERVKVERSIQKYKPNWKFFILGMTGAVFAGITANTDLIIPSGSVGQQAGFNVAAAILAGLSFSNMEPVGEPIFTGESQLQRRSGSEIIQDTTRTDSIGENMNISLEIQYQGEAVFSESDIVLSDGSFDINLATFLDFLDDNVNAESSIDVMLAYNGFQSVHTVPVTDFLAPFVTVTEPVAVLRNAPSVNELNVVTEVGIDSAMELIGRESENWYRVRFGGSEVFLSVSAGQIKWMSEAETGSRDIFEFAEIPFGDIDVENSVPVLKQNNPNDRAVILTNGFSESSEPRQYLARDIDLFQFYMRYAFQMAPDQIHRIETDSSDVWKNSLGTISEMDSTGTLMIYLAGTVTVGESGKLYLNRENAESNHSDFGTVVLDAIESIQPSALVLFADVDFNVEDEPGMQNGYRNLQNPLRLFSNMFLRRKPNSAILFSNRPGQQSSLYIGSGNENKRHHIFSYFLADALKKRNTTLAEISRYLENNVDYTSRRLHDRPQEIQIFGNLTINLAE